MKLLQKLLIGLSLPLIISLSGCGSSAATDGGIGGTGVSVGVLTQYGSIFVNGVEFDTTNAAIFVDGVQVGSGDAAVVSNLPRGAIMRVHGSINDDKISGVANTVYFNDNLTGPVAATPAPADLGANTWQIQILGQNIIIDDRTLFQPLGFGLSDVATSADSVLQVSGLVDASGTLFATYVKRTALNADLVNDIYNITGVISNLDVTAQTFSLNGLTVNYINAGGLDHATLANGQFIEAKGQYNTSTSQLDALSLELEVEIGERDADKAEIQGLVTNIDNLSSNQFTLGMQRVQITNKTRFESGVLADITLGARLEVEGKLVNAVVVADEISFENEIELRSLVAANSAGMITLDGLPGINVSGNGLTEVKGSRGAFNDIVATDYVKIRGHLNASKDRLIATQIETEALSSKRDVEIQGRVTSLISATQTISIIIDTFEIDASVGGISFEGVDEQTLSAGQFFSSVHAGEVVQASGMLDTSPSPPLVIWNKIALEDDD